MPGLALSVDPAFGSAQYLFATLGSRWKSQENPVSRQKIGLLVRDVEGEVVVLDPERDQVHQFNASASLIWRLHAEGKEVDEIVKGLETAFELEHDKAQEDSRAALAEFRRLGLIS